MPQVTKVKNTDKASEYSYKKMFIFGGSVSLIGALILYFNGKSVSTHEASKTWPSVIGTVVSSTQSKYTIKKKIEGGSERIVYQPNISYEYVVNKVSFKGSRIRVNKINNHFPQNYHKEKYPIGKKVMVIYNPMDPKDSLLEIYETPFFWFFPTIGYICLFFPLILLVLNVLAGFALNRIVGENKITAKDPS